MFNLIPTEPDEYKIYADWLEDQGVVLTASIRKGILMFDNGYGGTPKSIITQYGYKLMATQFGYGFASGSYGSHCGGCPSGHGYGIGSGDENHS